MHIVTIMAQLENIMDHGEYIRFCAGAGLFALPPVDYYAQVGIFMGACLTYPELPPMEAYAHLAHSAVRVADTPPVPVTLLDMVKSAGTEFGAWIKAGMPKRSQEEVDAALAICRGCDFRQELPGGLLRCDQRKGGCGCMADIKAWMATASCPQGKW
jgi:hypothetical protein